MSKLLLRLLVLGPLLAIALVIFAWALAVEPRVSPRLDRYASSRPRNLPQNQRDALAASLDSPRKVLGDRSVKA
jgi:hypothetical protein